MFHISFLLMVYKNWRVARGRKEFQSLSVLKCSSRPVASTFVSKTSSWFQFLTVIFNFFLECRLFWYILFLFTSLVTLSYLSSFCLRLIQRCLIILPVFARILNSLLLIRLDMPIFYLEYSYLSPISKQAICLYFLVVFI